MATKIVRLTSGEEIICSVETEKDAVVLFNPAIIVAMQGEVGLAPWLFYANIKEGVTIELKNILFIVDPSDEMKTNYEQGFVPKIRGLVLPEKKLAVPSLRLAD